MRTLDLSPFNRFSVGFDHMQRQLEGAMRTMDNGAPSYPPYNIEACGEDDYRISMAVAGFGEDDLDITQTANTLVVTGGIEGKTEEEGATYLHRGIATRNFERRFELADHIKVVGADLVNGLLNIDLKREVPETEKPRKIDIAAKLEQKAA